MMLQWAEALHHNMGCPGFDFRWGPWKFLSGLILLSIFSWPWVHWASDRNKYQGILLRGKVRPERGADNLPVMVVPNVKSRMEAQHSIPLWVSMTCYGKPLPFTTTVTTTTTTTTTTSTTKSTVATTITTQQWENTSLKNRDFAPLCAWYRLWIITILWHNTVLLLQVGVQLSKPIHHTEGTVRTPAEWS